MSRLARISRHKKRRNLKSGVTCGIDGLDAKGVAYENHCQNTVVLRPSRRIRTSIFRRAGISARGGLSGRFALRQPTLERYVIAGSCSARQTKKDPSSWRTERMGPLCISSATGTRGSLGARASPLQSRLSLPSSNIRPQYMKRQRSTRSLHFILRERLPSLPSIRLRRSHYQTVCHRV